LLFPISNKPPEFPLRAFPYLLLAQVQKIGSAFFFLIFFSLLRGRSVLGALTPSRNDQDRKHVVVVDSNSNPFDQPPQMNNQDP